MIAIPIDKSSSTTISKLFGNVSYFALLDEQSGSVTVVKNEVKGDGPASAEFLKSHGVDATVFAHMGAGVYKAFKNNQIDVYKEPSKVATLEDIYQCFIQGSYTKLDDMNYKSLLDPGEGMTCKCGCEDA